MSETQNTTTPNEDQPKTVSSFIETVSDGLGYLLKDFPAGFSANDELKQELGIDSKRRDLRLAGMILIPFAVSGLIIGLKFKLFPLIFAIAANYSLYRVLKALVTVSRSEVSAEDKGVVVEFLSKSLNAEYCNKSNLEGTRKDFKTYSDNIQKGGSYELLDQLLKMVSKTIGEDNGNLHRCAYNVRSASPCTSDKSFLERVWALVSK